MATIEATIAYLNNVPEMIKEQGVHLVQNSTIAHGHVDTGEMYNNIRGEVWEDHVRIWIWRKYAGLVNDGHAGADPGHIMTFKITNKWPAISYIRKRDGAHIVSGIKARRVGGYAGSGFFDSAAEQLRAWVKTL